MCLKIEAGCCLEWMKQVWTFGSVGLRSSSYFWGGRGCVYAGYCYWQSYMCDRNWGAGCSWWLPGYARRFLAFFSQCTRECGGSSVSVFCTTYTRAMLEGHVYYTGWYFQHDEEFHSSLCNFLCPLSLSTCNVWLGLASIPKPFVIHPRESSPPW